MGPDKTIHQSNSTKSTSSNYNKYANKNCNNDTNSTKGYTHYGFTRSNSEHDEVEDQRLEDTTWTTIEYKNKSIFTQYVLYAHAFLQKYLKKWKKTVQKNTPIMVLQEAIVNMIEVDDQRLEDTTG